MAQQAPPPQPVNLFDSAHEGYGDSQRQTIKQSYDLYRGHGREYSYNRVGGGTMRLATPGEAAAGPAVTYMLTPFVEPPVFAAEWEAPTINPVIYIIGTTSRVPDPGVTVIGAVAGGAYTTVATLSDGHATDGAMHDDGSGIPYLYVAREIISGGIDGGGAPGSTLISRMNRAQAVTTAAHVTAHKLLSLNNDLYIAEAPAGGSYYNAVGKIPAGTDPAVAAAPALTLVGFPGASINNLAASGDGRAPLALKPDGIYGYDRSLDLWVPLGRIPYHADNGKAFWYEDSDLCVALGEGGAVRVHGTTIAPYDPLPLLISTPDVDTPTQVIAAAGQMRQWGVLVTKPGAKAQRTGGTAGVQHALHLWKTTDGGATYSIGDAAIADGNGATAFSIGSLGTLAGGDYLLVGHPQPFAGVRFDIPHNPNTTASVLRAAYWNGSAFVTAPTFDTTDGDGVTFQQSGWVLPQTDWVVAGWQPSTVNGVTAYWARFDVSAALDAATDIAGLDVLPWRPSIDSVLFGNDGLDRAGVWPHVLFSRTDESGRHVVHDLGTFSIMLPGRVIYADGGGNNAGTPSNQNRSLWVFGSRLAVSFAVQPDDQEGQYAWPILAPNGYVELPSRDLGAVMEIEELTVEGIDWNATGYVYYRWDDGKPWQRTPAFDELPVTFRNLGGAGRHLKLALAYQLTAVQQQPTQRPRFTGVDAIVRPSSQRPVRLPQQTPPVV